MRVIELTNRLQWSFQGSVFQNALTTGDVDGDGSNEFVIGSSSGNLAIFKGRGGSGDWVGMEDQVKPEENYWDQVELGKYPRETGFVYDDSNFIETPFTRKKSRLIWKNVIDKERKGRLPWATASGLGTITSITVANICETGLPTIIVATGEGKLHLFMYPFITKNVRNDVSKSISQKMGDLLEDPNSEKNKIELLNQLSYKKNKNKCVNANFSDSKNFNKKSNDTGVLKYTSDRSSTDQNYTGNKKFQNISSIKINIKNNLQTVKALESSGLGGIYDTYKKNSMSSFNQNPYGDSSDSIPGSLSSKKVSDFEKNENSQGFKGFPNKNPDTNSLSEPEDFLEPKNSNKFSIFKRSYRDKTLFPSIKYENTEKNNPDRVSNSNKQSSDYLGRNPSVSHLLSPILIARPDSTLDIPINAESVLLSHLKENGLKQLIISTSDGFIYSISLGFNKKGFIVKESEKLNNVVHTPPINTKSISTQNPEISSKVYTFSQEYKPENVLHKFYKNQNSHTAMEKLLSLKIPPSVVRNSKLDHNNITIIPSTPKQDKTFIFNSIIDRFKRGLSISYNGPIWHSDPQKNQMTPDKLPDKYDILDNSTENRPIKTENEQVYTKFLNDSTDQKVMDSWPVSINQESAPPFLGITYSFSKSPTSKKLAESQPLTPNEYQALKTKNESINFLTSQNSFSDCLPPFSPVENTGGSFYSTQSSDSIKIPFNRLMSTRENSSEALNHIDQNLNSVGESVNNFSPYYKNTALINETQSKKTPLFIDKKKESFDLPNDTFDIPKEQERGQLNGRISSKSKLNDVNGEDLNKLIHSDIVEESDRFSAAPQSTYSKHKHSRSLITYTKNTVSSSNIFLNEPEQFPKHRKTLSGMLPISDSRLSIYSSPSTNTSKVFCESFSGNPIINKQKKKLSSDISLNDLSSRSYNHFHNSNSLSQSKSKHRPSRDHLKPLSGYRFPHKDSLSHDGVSFKNQYGNPIPNNFIEISGGNTNDLKYFSYLNRYSHKKPKSLSDLAPTDENQLEYFHHDFKNIKKFSRSTSNIYFTNSTTNKQFSSFSIQNIKESSSYPHDGPHSKKHLFQNPNLFKTFEVPNSVIIKGVNDLSLNNQNSINLLKVTSSKIILLDKSMGNISTSIAGRDSFNHISPSNLDRDFHQPINEGKGLPSQKTVYDKNFSNFLLISKQGGKFIPIRDFDFEMETVDGPTVYDRVHIDNIIDKGISKKSHGSFGHSPKPAFSSSSPEKDEIVKENLNLFSTSFNQNVKTTVHPYGISQQFIPSSSDTRKLELTNKPHDFGISNSKDSVFSKNLNLSSLSMIKESNFDDLSDSFNRNPDHDHNSKTDSFDGINIHGFSLNKNHSKKLSKQENPFDILISSQSLALQNTAPTGVIYKNIEIQSGKHFPSESIGMNSVQYPDNSNNDSKIPLEIPKPKFNVGFPTITHDELNNHCHISSSLQPLHLNSSIINNGNFVTYTENTKPSTKFSPCNRKGLKSNPVVSSLRAALKLEEVVMRSNNTKCVEKGEESSGLFSKKKIDQNRKILNTNTFKVSRDSKRNEFIDDHDCTSVRSISRGISQQPQSSKLNINSDPDQSGMHLISSSVPVYSSYTLSSKINPPKMDDFELPLKASPFKNFDYTNSKDKKSFTLSHSPAGLVNSRIEPLRPSTTSSISFNIKNKKKSNSFASTSSNSDLIPLNNKQPKKENFHKSDFLNPSQDLTINNPESSIRLPSNGKLTTMVDPDVQTFVIGDLSPGNSPNPIGFFNQKEESDLTSATKKDFLDSSLDLSESIKTKSHFISFIATITITGILTIYDMNKKASCTVDLCLTDPVLGIWKLPKTKENLNLNSPFSEVGMKYNSGNFDFNDTTPSKSYLKMTSSVSESDYIVVCTWRGSTYFVDISLIYVFTTEKIYSNISKGFKINKKVDNSSQFRDLDFNLEKKNIESEPFLLNSKIPFKPDTQVSESSKNQLFSPISIPNNSVVKFKFLETINAFLAAPYAPVIGGPNVPCLFFIDYKHRIWVYYHLEDVFASNNLYNSQIKSRTISKTSFLRRTNHFDNSLSESSFQEKNSTPSYIYQPLTPVHLYLQRGFKYKWSPSFFLPKSWKSQKYPFLNFNIHEPNLDSKSSIPKKYTKYNDHISELKGLILFENMQNKSEFNEKDFFKECHSCPETFGLFLTVMNTKDCFLLEIMIFDGSETFISNEPEDILKVKGPFLIKCGHKSVSPEKSSDYINSHNLHSTIQLNKIFEFLEAELGVDRLNKADINFGYSKHKKDRCNYYKINSEINMDKFLFSLESHCSLFMLPEKTKNRKYSIFSAQLHDVNISSNSSQCQIISPSNELDDLNPPNRVSPDLFDFSKDNKNDITSNEIGGEPEDNIVITNANSSVQHAYNSIEISENQPDIGLASFLEFMSPDFFSENLNSSLSQDLDLPLSDISKEIDLGSIPGFSTLINSLLYEY
ncbi:hypothetical protein AYI68_g2123 [Smittium mucronatum]|uniref:Uncharacterized protein n=1 Tax=Smittium mucronatum TaxID=133383 RepID=A0A1R0H3L0_9FUNG|nr:hypothetical protein AYI68_g2123 [Smittium mucronatum]